MFADPSEPIGCVAVIGLTTVHDAVDESAVSVFNGLGYGVGRVEVVVPEKDQGADEFLAFVRDFGGFECFVERAVQGGFGLDAGARAGSERRWFGRGQQMLELHGNGPFHGTEGTERRGDFQVI